MTRSPLSRDQVRRYLGLVVVLLMAGAIGGAFVPIPWFPIVPACAAILAMALLRYVAKRSKA